MIPSVNARDEVPGKCDCENSSVGCGEGYLIPERPMAPGRKPVGQIATKQSGLLQIDILSPCFAQPQRRLRRRDVDMLRGCVTVREGAKNEYRQRTIPLNAAARESMEFILKRWAEIGGSSPEHYILPHRPRGTRAPHWKKTIPWILDEPTTSLNSAFRSIRNAAELPHFRIYDCRVQAITKLLSSPKVSAQASKEIAGHISQAMQDRYSIQTFSTRKAALDTLDTPPPAPGTSEATPRTSGGHIIAFPGKRARA